MDLLHAFKVETEDIDQTPTYPNLQAAALEAKQSLRNLRETVASRNGDALDQQIAQDQLNRANLIIAAYELVNNSDAGLTQLLASNYMRFSTLVFGHPDSATGHALVQRTVDEMASYRGKSGVNQALLEQVITTYGIQPSGAPLGPNPVINSAVLAEVQNFLLSRYQPAFDALDGAPFKLDAEAIVAAFNAALRVMPLNEMAAHWKARIVQRKGGIETVGVESCFDIPFNLTLTRPRLKALYAHEACCHGVRFVHGKRLGRGLESGWPGYHIEEGLGIIFEMAMGPSGEVPLSAVNRYADTCWALGLIDGTFHSRREVYELMMARQWVRAQARKGSLDAGNLETFKRLALAHAVRLFRGTTGEPVGVAYLGDTDYYGGMALYMAFLAQCLLEGTMEQSLERMLSGKYNPFDPVHNAALEQLLAK